jgi:hypothetical protein
VRSSALLAFALAHLGAGALRADVIPPGHRPVEHVFAVSEPLPAGLTLVAAPTSGFTGVQVVAAGTEVAFSTKYGTRLYALPAGTEIPGDLEALRAAAVASADLPMLEVTSTPLTSPMSKYVTPLRVERTPEGGLAVTLLEPGPGSVIAARGNLLLLALILAAAFACGVVLLIVLVRRLGRAKSE